MYLELESASRNQSVHLKPEISSRNQKAHFETSKKVKELQMKLKTIENYLLHEIIPRGNRPVVDVREAAVKRNKARVYYSKTRSV